MNHRLAHVEATANAITGIALSQLVLWGFGVEFRQALALNAVMLLVSYARSYVLRRLFMRALLKRPAARITRGDAVNVLDALVKDGKAAMAARTLAYSRAAFSWAHKRGKVPGNPFHGLPISTSSASRDRVLTDAELATFWTATADMPYPWGPFYRLAALTLQRRDEVAGMRWSEISGDFSTWRIPAARMKSGRPHDVHLVESARAVLRTMPRMRGVT